jgi:serine O-acetyltransferase
MRPERIWWYSTVLHSKGWKKAAQALARLNYFLFKADLPAECKIAQDVKLFHRGLGVVINPEVTIESGVRIVHNVTIGVVVGTDATRTGRVLVEKNVRIGVGAVILASPGKTLVLGEGCQIGAMCYIRDSVAPGDVVLAPLARSKSSF